MLFAATSDGKTVRLGDDGKWEFVREIPTLPDELHRRLVEVPWGAKAADVLRLERLQPVEVDDDELEFRMEIADSPYRLTYRIGDDDEGLYLVKYEREDEDYEEDVDYDREWSILTLLLSKAFGDAVKSANSPRAWTQDDLEYWRASERLVPRRWAVYQDDATRAILTLTGSDNWIIGMDLELRPIV